MNLSHISNYQVTKAESGLSKQLLSNFHAENTCDSKQLETELDSCKGMQFLTCLCEQRGNMVFKRNLESNFTPRSFSSVLFLILKSSTFETILELQVTKRWHLSGSVVAFIWFSVNHWNSLLVLNSNFFITVSKLKLLV